MSQLAAGLSISTLAFNLLSKCDEELYALAQGAADDIAEEPAGAVAAASAESQREYEEQMRLSEKCICGADAAQDANQVVDAKKVVTHAWEKEGGALKGKKLPF